MSSKKSDTTLHTNIIRGFHAGDKIRTGSDLRLFVLNTFKSFGSTGLETPLRPDHSHDAPITLALVPSSPPLFILRVWTADFRRVITMPVLGRRRAAVAEEWASRPRLPRVAIVAFRCQASRTRFFYCP